MKIWYMTPYDTKKRIGTCHNQCCEIIRDSEDWICLLDPDTAFLTPDFGAVIEKALITYGSSFDLFGCLSNRISVPHQQYAGMSENTDLSYHMAIAEKIKGNNIVKPCTLVAGMFMLFQKKTWTKVGGFNQSIRFDMEFSKAVMNRGGKLGIIQSVYLLHLYRFGSPNPSMNYRHLL